MGRNKFRDLIITVEDAFQAHAVLQVKCTRCGHYTNKYAWTIFNARPKDLENMKLGQPLPGFRCRACRRSVSAVLTVAGFLIMGLSCGAPKAREQVHWTCRSSRLTSPIVRVLAQYMHGDDEDQKTGNKRRQNGDE